MNGQRIVTAPDQDRTLEYRDNRYGKSGRCRVRLWTAAPGNDGRLLVLVSELDDNPGPSVTNACEAICSALEVTLGKVFKDFDIVEHYEANLFRPAPLALVSFAHRDPFGRPALPAWTPLPERLEWLETFVAR